MWSRRTGVTNVLQARAKPDLAASSTRVQRFNARPHAGRLGGRLDHHHVSVLALVEVRDSNNCAFLRRRQRGSMEQPSKRAPTAASVAFALRASFIAALAFFFSAFFEIGASPAGAGAASFCMSCGCTMDRHCRRGPSDSAAACASKRYIPAHGRAVPARRERARPVTAGVR